MPQPRHPGDDPATGRVRSLSRCCVPLGEPVGCVGEGGDGSRPARPRHQPVRAVVGFQVTSVEHGRARVRLPTRLELFRPGGVLQGGCAMTLADGTCWVAIMSVTGPDEASVTLEQTSTFLGAARSDLLCDAELLRHRPLGALRHRHRPRRQCDPHRPPHLTCALDSRHRNPMSADELRSSDTGGSFLAINDVTRGSGNVSPPSLPTGTEYRRGIRTASPMRAQSRRGLNRPGFGRDSLLGSGDQADQVPQRV